MDTSSNSLIEAFLNFSCIDEIVCGFSFPYTEEAFQFLSSQGISTIVSLSAEPASKKLAKQYHIHVIHLPILNAGIPSSSDVTEFFSIMQKARIQRKKVGVHCLYGRGRTGVMLALYLIKFHKMDPLSAIEKIRSLRPGSLNSRLQTQFVLDFRKDLQS